MDILKHLDEVYLLIESFRMHPTPLFNTPTVSFRLISVSSPPKS